MKVNLQNLPPAVIHGGYVYIVAFSNDTIKVGKTISPVSRIASHVGTAARFDIDVTNVWVSAPHVSYSESEKALISMAGALSTEPDVEGKHTEYFVGVDFRQLVALCGQLGLDQTLATQIDASAARSRAKFIRHGAPERKQLDTKRRGAAFAKLICDARHALGFTQQYVVGQSGVAKSTLIRWEAGRAERPDPDQVALLCKFLRISRVDAAVALGYIGAEDLPAAAGAA